MTVWHWTLPSPSSSPSLNTIRDVTNPPNNPVWESTTRSWLLFHGPARLAMVFVAGFLLIVCSLMAGLILSVCALDHNILRVRSVICTDQERKQAAVVLRLKSHSTWMLCSLIIVSVACGEALPFVVQTVFDIKQLWIPIVVSTLSIAIFAEIVPQHLMPRHALWWSYYCSPLIWFCMWFTAIVSLPLSWILQSFSPKKAPVGVFNVEELAALVKKHEQSGNNRGTLGRDVTRIIAAALGLDSQQDAPNSDNEKDLEKADLVTSTSNVGGSLSSGSDYSIPPNILTAEGLASVRLSMKAIRAALRFSSSGSTISNDRNEHRQPYLTDIPTNNEVKKEYEGFPVELLNTKRVGRSIQSDSCPMSQFSQYRFDIPDFTDDDEMESVGSVKEEDEKMPSVKRMLRGFRRSSYWV